MKGDSRRQRKKEAHKDWRISVRKEAVKKIAKKLKLGSKIVNKLIYSTSNKNFGAFKQRKLSEVA